MEAKIARQNFRPSYPCKANNENSFAKFNIPPTNPQHPSPNRFQKPTENSALYASSSSPKPQQSPKANQPDIQTPHNPYARPITNKCYKCNQPGHRLNECPQRKMVNMAADVSEDEFMDFF